MINLFLLLHNMIDYPLRQAFHWKRKGLSFKNEDKSCLFADLPSEERERLQLQILSKNKTYHLDHLFLHSLVDVYLENLYYLDLLETAFARSGVTLPDELQAADIGPSSWFYVQAYANFLYWWGNPRGRKVRLKGFEIDPYRVFADLHSRYDHALAHMGGLEGVEYFPQAFHVNPAAYQLISMFFPFIFSRDHLEWGLPIQKFSPLQLLMDAWASLSNGGVLLVVNQGKEEANAQQLLFQKYGIHHVVGFEFTSPFFSYNLSRYVHVAVKND